MGVRDKEAGVLEALLEEVRSLRAATTRLLQQMLIKLVSIERSQTASRTRIHSTPGSGLKPAPPAGRQLQKEESRWWAAKVRA